jgi:toluene monooxygenase system ferredoxin subunit
MTKTLVCKASDVPVNEMRRFDLPDGQQVLVANAEGQLYAYPAMCPHQDVDLGDGFFDGKTLTCHQHLWQWDVHTGSAVGLAEAPLVPCSLVVQGDEVYLGQDSAIGASELFAGLPAQTLAELEALAVRQTFQAGQDIYRVGDPAENIYVFESGRVEFLIGRDGRTTAAGFIVKKGELFGWAALIDQFPMRIARATCHADTVVLCLNGKETLRVLETAPSAAYAVMRRLCTLVTRYLSSEGMK